MPGVGTKHTATLLVLAGNNPERLKSEASFASLCGVSPENETWRAWSYLPFPMTRTPARSCYLPSMSSEPSSMAYGWA